MTEQDFDGLLNGVYRLHYSVPGMSPSVGAVGRYADGRAWFAPSNWSEGVPCFDLGRLERVELIATKEADAGLLAVAEVEVAKLQTIIDGLTLRIADQSELLARVAERQNVLKVTE